MTAIRSRKAFTLVEVVISLAVVTVAVISIMGLMTVFLEGTKTVVERSEALSICQALNAYLETPNNITPPFTQGFDKVYQWIQGGTVPQLYAFVIPIDPSTPKGTYDATGVPQMQIASQADTNYAYIGNRIGRLYYISLSLSPNVPFHEGVARTAIYSPTPLPATWYPTGSQDTTFYADSSLALSVRVYAVPDKTSLTALQLENQNFNYPILRYDTTVDR